MQQRRCKCTAGGVLNTTPCIVGLFPRSLFLFLFIYSPPCSLEATVTIPAAQDWPVWWVVCSNICLTYPHISHLHCYLFDPRRDSLSGDIDCTAALLLMKHTTNNVVSYWYHYLFLFLVAILNHSDIPVCITNILWHVSPAPTRRDRGSDLPGQAAMVAISGRRAYEELVVRVGGGWDQNPRNF